MFNIYYSNDMTFKDKLIIITIFVFIFSFIASLIFRNIAFILISILFSIFLFNIYLFNKQETKEFKEKLETQSRDILNNKLCIKPNKNNPFMNPSILDISENVNYKACNIDSMSIKNEINKFFKEPVFKDVRDIYNRNFSERQFYTVPSTTIPNDQETFSKWLYFRKYSCKENNGEQCLNNIM